MNLRWTFTFWGFAFTVGFFFLNDSGGLLVSEVHCLLGTRQPESKVLFLGFSIFN